MEIIPLKLSKKGVFFTFLAIMIVTAMVLLFSGVPNILLSKDKEFVQSNFLVFDSFSKDIDGVFIPSALQSGGRMALKAMIIYDYGTFPNYAPNYIASTERDTFFTELMVNGTINNFPQPAMATNLTYLNKNIKEKSWEYLKIKTNITFHDIKLSQTDPWFVTVSANVSVYTEKDNLKYEFNKTYRTNVSIIGLEDPLFFKKDLADFRVNRTINKRDTYNDWRATTVPFNPYVTLEMIINSTYTNTSTAPSFLMRLTNNITASDCCGIESLINSSFSDINRPYVDYIYFNATPAYCSPGSELYNYTLSIYNPEALGFKLDSLHETYYNLSSNINADACS